MGFHDGLKAHLQSSATTVARAWQITRKDGVIYGFTDHDCDLTFDGVTFRASTGLTATAIEQGTGLSVDNLEAVGMLTDAAVRDEDIEAGRFDGAEIVAWLLNWSNVGDRQVVFRGSIGEIRRAGGAFTAELRGLSETLNIPRGGVYQRPCSAVLGDRACKFDLGGLGFTEERAVEEIEDGRVLRWRDLDGFEDGWFTRGRLEILSGDAVNLEAVIKADRFLKTGAREIELWETLRAKVQAGDFVRLTVGCDKRFQTCRYKFGNLVNFRGFPDIPGEDWITSYPVSTTDNSGGSLR
ncbi:DUF2163 domain-containing protein [Shimia haliotis]|uniref:Bacteriophage phiJL001 Gp84 C-terminal domain-containing protein n=1 Tax=Shimia haliotis TaxID=1280847 RepID=A0A1I4BE09_9RHOB|nr:DUF2163 domain-containing protein [Shimia haliotis]SFK66530.1 phage conserved hypothetical protein BR0599 [Shimia haliotis]